MDKVHQIDAILRDCRVVGIRRNYHGHQRFDQAPDARILLVFVAVNLIYSDCLLDLDL
jgi:hypothetical protein